MTLIVETGTGLENAESYSSVATLQAYVAARGLTVTGAFITPSYEAALRRGTTYLDGRYAGRWPGTRLNGRGQALDWPRVNAYDSSGYLLPDDEVPREVVQATNEAAYRELITPGSLTPDVTGGARVIGETVGPISIRYSDKGDAATVARPTVTAIDEILWPLLRPGGSSVATLRRA